MLGRVWTCDEGSGDNEVGCLSTNPADLSDAWELNRACTAANGGTTAPFVVNTHGELVQALKDIFTAVK